MANVVLCSEIDKSSQELVRLADCAVELRAQGHSVRLICQDIALAHSMDEFAKVSIFPSPWHQSYRADGGAPNTNNVGSKPPLNYSSLLLADAFQDSSTLVPLLRSWLHFLATLDTDLIIADHSPVALFASALLDIPCVMIGEGFRVPPIDQPLSSAMPWHVSERGADMQESDRFFEDQALLHTLNAAVKNLGFHNLEFLEAQELFAHVSQWLFTLPEMDHYGERSLPYIECRERSKQSAPHNPVWPTGPGEYIFVYMDADAPQLPELLLQLKDLDDPVLAVIPNATQAFIREYEADTLHVQRDLVNMQSAMERCKVFINHGGHDLVYTLLLNGIPSVLLPYGHASNLLSYRLAEQQLAFYQPPASGKLEAANLIASVREFGVVWDNTRSLASRYQENQGFASLHDLIAAKLPANVLSTSKPSTGKSAAIAK